MANGNDIDNAATDRRSGDQDIFRGSNQSGLRDYNERLVLSMIQRFGALPGVEIARRAGLSSQTVSVILRSLEKDGLVKRGTPQRGRIGKPSIPMGMDPDGAFSVGLKIGRRSADVLIVDFEGHVRHSVHMTYRYPMPQQVIGFLRDSLREATEKMGPQVMERLAGIGVATPFEIWRWHDTIGAPVKDMDQWRDFSLLDGIGAFTDLPVFVQNDATSACRAEQTYGRGRDYRDFAYFYIGAFIGGGIVLNHSIFDGPKNNAGAFGSLPVDAGPDGKPRQLIDVASLYLLEQSLVRAGVDPLRLWAEQDNWDIFEPQVAEWIETTAPHLARAALTVCAVVDFEAVLIDGAMPADVRERLVARVAVEMGRLDDRGLELPQIAAGTIGRDARSMGAASTPINAKYFLNSHGPVTTVG